MRLRAFMGMSLALATAAFGGESSPIALEWVAPEGCPSQNEMLEQIAQIVGPVAPEAARRGPIVSARVTASRGEGQAWVAEIAISASGTNHVRQVEGHSCTAVANASALIVALAASPEAPPVEMPLLDASPHAKDAPSASPSKPSRRTVVVGGTFVLDHGMLPGASPGAELLIGWNPRHLQLEVHGAWIASQRATASNRNEASPAGADISLAQVGTRACYELFDKRFDVGPCGGMAAVWMMASGFGSERTLDPTAPTVVASGGLRAVGRVSSQWALRFMVEGEVPLARPEFVLSEGSTALPVYRAPAWALRTSGGIELHF